MNALMRAWAVGAVLALTLVGVFGAPTASAAVLSIEPYPAHPTDCDTVAVVVKGELPADCYDIYSVTLRGPVLLPTASIVPQYELAVQIVVREPNPQIYGPCSLVPVPYQRWLDLPFHPPGQYWVVATEYITPFFSPTPAAAIDSSRVDTTFTVAADACTAGSCYFLDFRHPLSTLGPCDGGGAPGDTACVEITLGNREPVAGVESVVRVFDPRLDPVPGVPLSGDLLRPIRARAIGRADGFHVAWTTDESTLKLILYSDQGQAIPEGNGPIVRVCYAIGHDATPGPYLLRFGETLVADSAGTEIPPCPTGVEVVGRFCVGEPPCDVDGNGRSNVLDIIRLVRCALGGPDSAAVCPDSVAARADCNEDGSIDVRDVICCVRKILAFGLGGMDQPKTASAARIGFDGPAEWSAPDEGIARLKVQPGSDFGGISFGIEAAPGTDITNVALPAGTKYHIDVDRTDPRMARVLIVRLSDAVPDEPLRLLVQFEARPGGVPEGAEMKIVRAESGSWSGLPAGTEITSGAVVIPAGSPAAPRVFPARPNPFTDATDIAYDLPAQRHVTLRVYSATGKLVRTLVDATVPLGLHRTAWNGRDETGRVVASGIYFVKLSTGDAESTIRVMRLR